MISLSVTPKIEVLSRKRAIFEIAAEFAEFILGDHQLEPTLRKGIYEQQLIDSVFFQIRLTETDEICAEILFEIDWKTHRVALRTGENSVEVRAESSVSEQIIESAPYLSALIDGYRNEYGETYVNAAFTYDPKVMKSKHAHEKALDILGHSAVIADDEAWYEPESGELFTKIEICPDELSEMKLTIKGVGAQKS